MSKKLLIFTKRFGENYTGATLATNKIFQELQYDFPKIHVICKYVGIHHFKNINIVTYKSWKEAILLLRQYNSDNTIFYSDDHFGFILKLSGKKYIHTYHGNWPDAKYISFKMFLYSFYFIPLYYFTIKFSSYVVNVSFYMHYKTKKWNENSVVIRNGISHKTKNVKELKSNKIIMIGNIDKRKYKYALQLFDEIQKTNIFDNFTVDIYGKIIEENIADRLNKYSFVNIKGYESNIIMDNYLLLLSMSSMENMPIAICEAVANKLPVFSTDVGGISEIVKPFYSGYLFSTKNTKYIIKILKAFLTKENVIEINNLKNEEYTWEFAAKQYKKLIFSIF